MKTITIQQRTGKTVEFTEEDIFELQSRMRGELITPDHRDYETRRRVWNATVNKHPGLIALCQGTADVMEVVDFARENSLLVSTRGGGHNVSGSAVVDRGLVIDMSEMRTVKVDPEEKTAWVQGGALLGDLDHETVPFGLAAPVGVVSETGVGGLTLHGGVGWLLRKHGMSIDSLLSVELVTSDGKLLKASKDRYPDLFWALRGGGGNFGAVTALEFRLHPIPPSVSFMIPVFPVDDAREIMQYADEYLKTAPRDLMVIATYWNVPELPELPKEVVGAPGFSLVGCYTGPQENAKSILEPLQKVKEPIVDLSGEAPWTDVQRLLDEDYPEGKYYYWKSLYLKELDGEALEIMKKYSLNKPSIETTIDIWFLGGAMQDVAPDETAFPNRNNSYMVAIEANWSDEKDNGENIQWARDLYRELKPYSAQGIYLNFPGLEEDQKEMKESAYGNNLERLQEIKKKYDPAELFAGIAGLMKPSSR